MSIESFVVEYIEGKRKSTLIRGLLYMCSLLFHVGCFLRHLLYDRGLLSVVKVPRPVISIGNIVAGGTGKTPFIEMLLHQIPSEKVAVIARGYRSQIKTKSLQISEGKGPIFPVSICGDESYWLAKKVGAQIWVGKDRVASARSAMEKKAKVILLEDGLQHRRLHRDTEIVLLHAKDLWGKGHFLPRGYIRDLPKRLAYADWIIVTYLEQQQNIEEIIQQIRRFSSAPIIGFSAIYLEAKKIEGKKIGAFCGIAKPKEFYEALQKLGAEVVHTRTSKDHVIPSSRELQQFAKECKEKEAQMLVCTEKDLVKLPSHEKLEIPLFVLQMQWLCVWNKDLWHELCQTIKQCEEI